MRFLGLFALALFAVSPTATAGGGCESGSVVHHIFEKADQNQDGTLTQAEFESAGLQEFGLSFGESDTNADGGISMTEYLELYEKHHPPVDGVEA